MYRLVFLSGRYEGRRIVVRQALTRLGSDPQCHLVLSDDEHVAPEHALLEEKGTGVFLSSLAPGSTILLNDVPLAEATRLAHNDRLTFGQTRVQYQEIIAPHARYRPSRGLLQPTTILAIVLILVFQIGLLAFLVNWQQWIIRPETEAIDLQRVEAIRAEREAPSADSQAAAPASIVARPGTTPRPVPATSTGAPGTESADAETQTQPELLQMLEVADFTPADTNLLLQATTHASPPPRDSQEVQLMLERAIAAAGFADHSSAFRILNQIHHMEPEFLPAHVEHARMLEKRGDLDAAQSRWNQVLDLDPSHPEARDRVDRLMRQRQLQSQPTPSPRPSAPVAATHPIRIVSPEIKRLPSDDTIQDMRVLSATLELPAGQRLFSNALVQVFITFYDSADGETPRPTRANTPPSPLVFKGPFTHQPSIPIEATYVATRDLRNRETAETGQTYRYDGYTLQVYLGQVLQDTVARPARLNEFLPQSRNLKAREAAGP